MLFQCGDGIRKTLRKGYSSLGFASLHNRPERLQIAPDIFAESDSIGLLQHHSFSQKPLESRANGLHGKLVLLSHVRTAYARARQGMTTTPTDAGATDDKFRHTLRREGLAPVADMPLSTTMSIRAPWMNCSRWIRRWGAITVLGAACQLGLQFLDQCSELRDTHLQLEQFLAVPTSIFPTPSYGFLHEGPRANQIKGTEHFHSYYWDRLASNFSVSLNFLRFFFVAPE